MKVQNEWKIMNCFKFIPIAKSMYRMLACMSVVIAFLVMHAWITLPASGQSSQNPSPMVEHVRQHPRLKQREIAGQRIKLSLGRLFIPESFRAHESGQPTPIVLAFHCGDWISELAVSQLERPLPCISFQLGAGSSRYASPFAENAELLGRLLKEAEGHLKQSISDLSLVGWSAGYGAIREILRQTSGGNRQPRVSRILLLDGLHTGYVGGKPGPLESDLETAQLEPFLNYAKSAVSNECQMLYVHTEIFPGTFASTTETADWLIKQLGLRRQAVLKWGPMQTQQLGETQSGGLCIKAFAGNSAPDHVDLLHAFPDFLNEMLK